MCGKQGEYCGLPITAKCKSFIVYMYTIHALILSPACDPNTHGIAICIHYFQVSSVKQAKLAKVVPTRNNGLPEIVTLHHDKVGDIAMFTWQICTDLILTPFSFLFV